ncbi:hypothetical protein HDU78_002352 [Chytriomyces hyalinus]|nr:hypothetical protein HDU78_002352 [Chytriomyces hyalinus]
MEQMVQQQQEPASEQPDSTQEDLNNQSVNNLHLLVQSIPVSPLPAHAKVFSNSSAPASTETSPVTDEDSLTVSAATKRRKLSLNTEKATATHPDYSNSDGRLNQPHQYNAPLTAPLREREPYTFPPQHPNSRTSQHGQTLPVPTNSSLRPASSGPVGSGSAKGTHGMINKLQQSMRVKEQQQALIEARLVSPPAGSQQNQSLPEPTQQQPQQQQQHAPQQTYLKPITPYPQSHTLHQKSPSASSNNMQPTSHSSGGRLLAAQTPSRQPLSYHHHQQVPRPIAQHPTPLARLNMPKHNRYQQGSDGGGLHSADPSNQSRAEFTHAGPATAGPTFHASSKLPSFPPPSPSAQSHHTSYPAPQQPATANAASSNSANLPSTSPQGSSNNSANRRAFVALFENVYDTASEDLPKLVSTLKDQMRKSSSLLQTLQASGQMIEGLVRSCFRDMQLQYGEKFGAALQDLNRRLEVLEEKLSTAGGNDGVAAESSIPSHAAGHSSVGGGGLPPSSRQEFVNNGFRGEPMTPSVKNGAASTEMNALLKSLLDRLEVLEKK